LSRFFLSLFIFDESLSSHVRSGLISWFRMRVCFINQLFLSARAPDLKAIIEKQTTTLLDFVSCDFLIQSKSKESKEGKEIEQLAQMVLME
jgi:hypothetical protein